MKENKKIKLRELKVKSFITIIENKEMVKSGDGVLKRMQAKYSVHATCKH